MFKKKYKESDWFKGLKCGQECFDMYLDSSLALSLKDLTDEGLLLILDSLIVDTKFDYMYHSEEFVQGMIDCYKQIERNIKMGLTVWQRS